MVCHPAFTVELAGVISALMVLGCASTVRRPTGGEPVCTTGGAAGIDTSGAEAFLAIAEELAKDHDPGEQAWTRLEESPGYAVLLKEEFPRDHFIISTGTSLRRGCARIVSKGWMQQFSGR